MTSPGNHSQLPEPTKPFKFHRYQLVEHIKTGHIYEICGVPDEYVIEKTWEPAYAYLLPSGIKCIRSQAEMEDGRFVPITVKGMFNRKLSS
jgi:hypothetical protein